MEEITYCGIADVAFICSYSVAHCLVDKHDVFKSKFCYSARIRCS